MAERDARVGPAPGSDRPDALVPPLATLSDAPSSPVRSPPTAHTPTTVRSPPPDGAVRPDAAGDGG